MSELSTAAAPQTSLREVLRSINSAFVQVVVSPAGVEVTIGSVTMLDADDVAGEGPAEAQVADLCLLVGVSDTHLLSWLERLTAKPTRQPPQALMTKAAASSAMAEAANSAGVALIAVHPQTRWDVLLVTIREVLDRTSVRSESAAPTDGLGGTDTDLYGLAQTVAALTDGMVSIEDERSRVLAYSASDEAADELRTLSILGRVGPAGYLRRLRDWGVFDRLQRSDDVIEVPADPDLGIRRRLVVGIRAVGAPDATSARGGRPTSMGTIWVQEGRRPLAPDADAVLRGASAIAARLITRAINAPTTEAVQIQRLLGARGGGVDVVSLAAALSLPTTGPAVVIGFATVDGTVGGGLSQLSPTLRLHASAFARDSLVTTIGERIYVLIPRAQSLKAVSSWTGSVIERMGARGTPALRAAIAAPVGNLSDVAAARLEVDRVLDGTSGHRRVTTLADSRTPVLLGEILDVLAAHPELADPRVTALLDYDRAHGSAVAESLETFLAHLGEVRTAAEHLHVHPNTLRYRVRRAGEILDIDLGDPAGRLLVAIQLALNDRRG